MGTHKNKQGPRARKDNTTNRREGSRPKQKKITERGIGMKCRRGEWHRRGAMHKSFPSDARVNTGFNGLGLAKLAAGELGEVGRSWPRDGVWWTGEEVFGWARVVEVPTWVCSDAMVPLSTLFRHISPFPVPVSPPFSTVRRSIIKLSLSWFRKVWLCIYYLLVSVCYAARTS